MADRGYGSPARRVLPNGSSDMSREMSRNPGQMQGLLSEFRGLYEGRLRHLDDADRAGEDTQKVIKTKINSSKSVKVSWLFLL